MALQMSLKRISVMACLLLLVGCSAHKIVSPNKDYVLSEQSEDGDVIMTVSSKGLYDVPFSLLYRKVADRSLFNIGELSLTYGYKYQDKDHEDKSIFKSHAKKYGQSLDQNSSESLHVFKLPAGDYEFYGMFIEKDYEWAVWTMVRDFSFTFSVVSGQSTYIGNLMINTKVIGNNDYVVESVLSRQDRSKDDVRLLNELFPAIDLTKVIVSSDIVKDKDVKITRMHYGTELGRGGLGISRIH
jgi:hypothetical protein